MFLQILYCFVVIILPIPLVHVEAILNTKDVTKVWWSVSDIKLASSN